MSSHTPDDGRDLVGVLAARFPDGVSIRELAHGWASAGSLCRVGPWLPLLSYPAGGPLICSEEGRNWLAGSGLSGIKGFTETSIAISDSGVTDLAKCLALEHAQWTSVQRLYRSGVVRSQAALRVDLDPLECDAEFSESGELTSVPRSAMKSDLALLVLGGDPGFGVGINPRIAVTERALKTISRMQPGWWFVYPDFVGL